MTTSTRESRFAITADVVTRFSRIATDHIADVLYGLGLNCLVQGLEPLAIGMKVCGIAFTMRYVPQQDPRKWTDELKLPDILPQTKAGEVWVIDMGGRTDCVGWGSNISRLAKTRGLAGVVVDGASRDYEQVMEVGLPVFARGRAMLHHHGILYPVNVNSEPVVIGVPPRSTSVAPGDLVVGDADGIVVVPPQWVERVLELAEQRFADETAGYDPDRPNWPAEKRRAYFEHAAANWGFNRILSER